MEDFDGEYGEYNEFGQDENDLQEFSDREAFEDMVADRESERDDYYWEDRANGFDDEDFNDDFEEEGI